MGGNIGNIGDGEERTSIDTTTVGVQIGALDQEKEDHLKE